MSPPFTSCSVPAKSRPSCSPANPVTSDAYPPESWSAERVRTVNAEAVYDSVQAIFAKSEQRLNELDEEERGSRDLKAGREHAFHLAHFANAHRALQTLKK